MGRGANQTGAAAALRAAGPAGSVRTVRERPTAGGPPEFVFPAGAALTAAQRGKLTSTLRSRPKGARELLLLGEPDREGTRRFSLPAVVRDGTVRPATGGTVNARGQIRWYGR